MRSVSVSVPQVDLTRGASDDAILAWDAKLRMRSVI